MRWDTIWTVGSYLMDFVHNVAMLFLPILLSEFFFLHMVLEDLLHPQSIFLEHIHFLLLQIIGEEPVKLTDLFFFVRKSKLF